MTSGCGLLVLDHDGGRRQDILTVLNFLGERCIAPEIGTISNAIAELRSSTSKAPDAVLLAGDTTAEVRDQTVAALRAWDPGVAVLLVGTNAAGVPLAAPFIASLGWPLQYTRLIDELQRGRVYREQFEVSRGRGESEIKQFRTLVGSSAGMRAVRRMMTQVAESEATVLVLGESGTGKEVVARSLHEHSRRRSGPFVPLNCGAIPAELLESELFGHEKGSFTGALSTRAGRFEMARGGTLFLDEIGDMPLAMQVKLLRVLQERSFERVGGTQTHEADVRIICATHKNLDDMIAKGSFREDLFYRINVFPIEVPALRERTDDLSLLINELVGRMERERRGSVRFSSSAIESLQAHAWPGNVRELANLVERMAIMHPDSIVGARDLPLKFRHLDIQDESFDVPVAETDHLPANHAGGSGLALLPLNGLDLKEHIQDIEKSLIEQALDDCGGVVARAADRLRLRRTTLVEKMRKYELLNRDAATED